MTLITSMVSYSAADLNVDPWVDQVLENHPTLSRPAVGSLLRGLITEAVQAAAAEAFVFSFLRNLPDVLSRYIHSQYEATTAEAYRIGQGLVLDLALAIMAGMDPVKQFLAILEDIFGLELDLRPPDEDENGDGGGDTGGGGDAGGGGEDGAGPAGPVWREVARCA